MATKTPVAANYSLIACFDGNFDSRYPLGDKPSGYQTTPTLLFIDNVAGPTSGGENNKGDYVSLFGYSFGSRAALGTAAGARVYFRDPAGANTWVEVDNYRSLLASKVYTTHQLQRITVQIGALGGKTGLLDVKVTVNGVDTNVLVGAFTVQPGRFFFVDNVTGDDSTGVVDDITHPFRYVQKATAGALPYTGIWASIRPGDKIIPRAGTWSDQVGMDSRWLRFFEETGIAPRGNQGTGHVSISGTANNGSGLIRLTVSSSANFTTGQQANVFAVRGTTEANGLWTITVVDATHIDLQGSTYTNAFSAGHGTITNYSGYIGIRAYPGPVLGHSPEVVKFVPAADQNGPIHGCSTLQAALKCGKYFQCFGLWITNSAVGVAAPSDSGLVNVQNGADYWDVIDNELGPFTVGASVANAKTAGVCGVGTYMRWLANYVHDIGGTSALENHGLYLGGADNNGYSQVASNSEAAYNRIVNITGGNGIQIFWGTTVLYGTSNLIHHNFIDTTAKRGINLSDGTRSVDVYNNVILSTVGDAIYYQGNADASLAIKITHNTCYNWGTGAAGAARSGFYNNGTVTGGSLHVQHNVFVMASGHDAAIAYYTNNITDTNITLAQNAYYDFNGTKTTTPAKDATALTYGNPLFTSVVNKNFTVTAGSPLLGACTAAEVIAVATDFYGIARPVTGTGAPGATKNDVGAMQGVGT